MTDKTELDRLKAAWLVRDAARTAARAAVAAAEAAWSAAYEEAYAAWVAWDAAKAKAKGEK